MNITSAVTINCASVHTGRLFRRTFYGPWAEDLAIASLSVLRTRARVSLEPGHGALFPRLRAAIERS